MVRIISICLFMLATVTFASAQIKSVYTKLDQKHCKALKPDRKNGEFERLKCGGVGGYWLQVLSGGDDTVVDVVTPSGKEFSADYSFAGHRVASGTSEWRVKGGRPISVIIRYSVQEPEGFKSYLVVTKISRSSACVVDMVPPGKRQNADARKLADSMRPCKKTT